MHKYAAADCVAQSSIIQWILTYYGNWPYNALEAAYCRSRMASLLQMDQSALGYALNIPM